MKIREGADTATPRLNLRFGGLKNASQVVQCLQMSLFARFVEILRCVGRDAALEAFQKRDREGCQATNYSSGPLTW